MATRSTIALEFADGTVQSVYCHFDGYLECVGELLHTYWSDPFKLQQLIEHGDMSSLGDSLLACTFYGRDRNEDNVDSDKFENFDDYRQNLNEEEYDYILRQIDGKPVWFVHSHMTQWEWVTLENAKIMEKEYVEMEKEYVK